jgi:hypothetical protein
MSQVEQEILSALIELEQAVQGGVSGGARSSLLPLFERVDQLTLRLPDDTDPNLLHYLHKKSYQKARLWLQGRDGENSRGGCLRD